MCADRKLDVDMNNAKLILRVRNLQKSRDKVDVSYPTDRLIHSPYDRIISCI